MTRIIEPAIEMIKSFEGCRLHSYKDSVGVWTIGWGHTLGVVPGEAITQGKADAFLMADVQPLITRIENMVKVPINNNEFCALLDFCFNLGAGSLFHSHLLTYLNLGLPKSTVAAQFALWDHAGGIVESGLTRRRRAEHDLFLS